jgi:hypothetical protein
MEENNKTHAASQPQGTKTVNKAQGKGDAQEHKPGDFGDYPEGDPEAGRIDPEEQAECITSEQIPMRDRRAYLLQQAERNERANDEINAIQVEQNKDVQFAQSMLQDPDVMRENSMDQAIAQLKQHDRATVLATRDDRRKMRREARLRGRGFSSSDYFVSGAAAPASLSADKKQPEPKK